MKLSGPRLVLSLGALSALPTLAGCYAGAAGIALLVKELSGGSGGGSAADAAPVLREVQVSPAGSRDRIRIEFTLENDDPGRLGLSVEYARLDDRLDPKGPPSPATPVPEANPLDLQDVPAGRRVGFTWDAGQDLAGGSDLVQLTLTPTEDGAAGRPFSPQPFRAGNTPVQVRNLTLLQRGGLVQLKFDLLDEESDLAVISALSISVDRGLYLDLPDGVLPALEREIRGAPGPKGSPVDLRFSLTDLDRPDAPPELARAGRPGFVGELSIELILREVESPSDVVTVQAAPQPFDNNEAPQAEVLPPLPEDLTSGVVPIRFRIFDQEENRVQVRLEVDPGDGVFRQAQEFPSAISEGTQDLSSLGLKRGPDLPFHVFLWDALAQGEEFTDAALRVTASDAEEGPASFPISMPDFTLVALERGAEVGAGDDPRTLLAGDFDDDGFEDVVVSNSTPGTVTFFRGGLDRLSSQEGRKLTFTVGANPGPLARGDFNGDGLLDFAVATRRSRDGSATGVVAYFQSAKGQPPVLAREIALGVEIVRILSADFDEDGRSDLLASRAGAKVSYLAGTAEGLTEGSRSDLDTLGQRASALLAGDFDGDGDLDALAVLPSGKLVHFPGRPAGLDPAGHEVPAGTSPGELFGGDFDRDGSVDVVIASTSLDQLTYLRWQSGAWTSAEEGKIDLGARARLLSGGDFDLDGWPELAVTTTAKTLILLAGGPGGLSRAPGRVLILNRSPSALQSGDFDGDGFPDLCIVNKGTDDLSFLRGGRQGLRVPVHLHVGDGPQDLAAGDFDGDGRLDLVTANNVGDSLLPFRGGARGLSSASELDLGAALGPSLLADFDGDRRPDLAVALQGAKKLTCFLGGEGGYSDVPARRRDLPGSVVVRLLLAGDSNGDGSSDLIAVTADPASLRFFPGGAAGLPQEESKVKILALEAVPAAILGLRSQAGPYLDLAVAEPGSSLTDPGKVQILTGRASGPQPGATFNAVPNPSLLASGDFDLDGSEDLLVASKEADALTYLPGGPGGFSARADPGGGGQFHQALAAADFDGDGFADVVLANAGGQILVLRGGSGGLLPGRAAPKVGLTPSAMAVADYDGDGFLDLAVASRGSSRLDCLQGGPGGFSNVAKSFPAASFPSALAGGDFDADGYTDLLVSGDSAGQLDEFCGGASGLKRSGALLSQAGPRALRPGDCDGDGFLDLVVISEASGLVGFFKQRYFTPHASAIVDREAQSATTLIDPRRPARFALEVSPEAFSSATHLSVVPGPVFDLPRGRLAREGKYLTAVTEPVTLLPESATVSVAAKLTLRLLESAEPESVRIVRRGPDGVGEILEGIEIQVIDFEGGQGVSFSITGFGSYLAAVVRTRP